MLTPGDSSSPFSRVNTCDIHYNAAFAVGHFQGSIADLSCLFAENGAQQTFLSGQIGFALGRHLAHQNIAGVNFSADADDAALVQILQRILAHVGNVAGNLFRPQLGVAGVQSRILQYGWRYIRPRAPGAR